MPSIEQRRPLRPGGVDLLSPQPPGLIPGSLAVCPAECTPRPRNLAEYQAACRTAEGAPVAEVMACQVMPGRSAYHNGRFLTVYSQERGDPDGHVELWLTGDGIDAVRVADMDAPIYCLA